MRSLMQASLIEDLCKTRVLGADIIMLKADSMMHWE